jgi:hypothetical protein
VAKLIVGAEKKLLGCGEIYNESFERNEDLQSLTSILN